jgi:DNA-binding CsgD family transcriptional regulator
LVSDELQGVRANGIANKDSIEWYKCDRSTVTDLIDGIAVAKGIKIHRKSWEGSLDLRYQKGEYEPYGEFAMELFKRRFVGLPKFDGESLVVASVNGILETITADEAEVLRVYFGLEDGCRKSIEETAQILNVHKRMVQEFKGRAMRKCKHPSRSEGLRDLFDDLFAHVSVR